MIKKYLLKTISLILGITLFLVSCETNNNTSVDTEGNLSQTLSISGLMLEGITADSVSIKWNIALDDNTAADDIAFLRVSILSNDIEVYKNDMKPDSSNSLYSKTVTGLSSGNLYEVKVKLFSWFGGDSTQTLWIVPTEKSFSHPTNWTENMLSKVMEISNAPSGTMGMTWEKKEDAFVYIIVTEKELVNSTGSLNLVDGNEEMKVVCLKEISDYECQGIKQGASNQIMTTLPSMENGSYESMVFPLTFRDLVGLKMIDDNGNKLTLLSAVKELMNDINSPIRRQINQVQAAMANKDLMVMSKMLKFEGNKNLISRGDITLSTNTIAATVGVPLMAADLPTISVREGVSVSFSSIAPTMGEDLGGVAIDSVNGDLTISPQRMGIVTYLIKVKGTGRYFGEVSLPLKVKSKYVITPSDLTDITTPSVISTLQLNSGSSDYRSIARGSAYIPDNDRAKQFSFSSPLKTFTYRNINTADEVTINGGLVTVGTHGVFGDTALNLVIHEDKILDNPSVNYRVLIKGLNSSVKSLDVGYGIVSSSGSDSIMKVSGNNLDTGANDVTTSSFQVENGKYLSLGFQASSRETISFSRIEIVPENISYATLPEIPGKITINPLTTTTNSMLVRWGLPSFNGYNADGIADNIIGYVLEYSNASGDWLPIDISGNGVRLRAPIVTGIVAAVGGLDPFTVYGFRVSAVNNKGKGSFTGVFTARTKSMGKVPVAPGQIMVGMTTASSAELSWNVPTYTGLDQVGAPGIITGYQIEYSNGSGNWTKLSNTAENNAVRLLVDIETRTNVTVIGLARGETYSFRVSALNIAGAGAASQAATVTIDSLAELPGIPGEINVGTTMGTNTTLSWGAPANTGKDKDGNDTSLTGYKIEYRTETMAWSEVGMSTVRLQSNIGINTNALVIGLTGGISYTFRVAAVNGSGAGSPTPDKVVETSSLAEVPGALSFNFVNGGSSVANNWSSPFVLKWNPPSDKGKNPDGSPASITGYVLEYFNSDGNWTVLSNINSSGGVRLFSPIGANTTAQLRDVKGVTTYRIRIAAVNDKGQGPWSTEKSARTVSFRKRSQGPIDVRVLALGETNVVITWDMPSDFGTEPDGSPATLIENRLYIYNGFSATRITTDGSSIRLQTDIGTNNTATVIGLTPNTLYNIEPGIVSSANVNLIDASEDSLRMTTLPKSLTKENVRLSTDSVTTVVGTSVTGADLPTISFHNGFSAKYASSYSIIPASDNNVGGVSINSTTGSLTISPEKLGVSLYYIAVKGTGNYRGEILLPLEVKSKYRIFPTDLPSINPVDSFSIQLNNGTASLVTIAQGSEYIPDNDRTSAFSFTSPLGAFAYRNNNADLINTDQGIITVGTAGVSGHTALNLVLHENKIVDDGSIDYQVKIMGLNPSKKSEQDGYGIVSSTGLADSVVKVSGNNLDSGANDTTTAAFKIEEGKYLSLGFEASSVNTISFTGIEIIPISASSFELVPGAPGEITVNPQTTTTNLMVLNWVPPSYAGFDEFGSPLGITAYKLEYSNVSGGWLPIVTSGNGIRLQSPIGVGTTAAVLGLAEATTYAFRVSAVNQSGTGKPSVKLISTAESLIDLSSPSSVYLSTNNVLVTARVASPNADLPVVMVPPGTKAAYWIEPTDPAKDVGGVSIDSETGVLSIKPNILGKADYTITVAANPGTTTVGEAQVTLTVRSKYVIDFLKDLPMSITVDVVFQAQGNSGEIAITNIARGEEYIPDNDRSKAFSFGENVKEFHLLLTSPEVLNRQGLPPTLTYIDPITGTIDFGKDSQAAPNRQYRDFGHMLLSLVLHENQILDDFSVQYHAIINNLKLTGVSDNGGYGIITSTGVADSVSKAHGNNLTTTATDTKTASFNIEDGKYLSFGFTSSPYPNGQSISFNGIEIVPE